MRVGCKLLLGNVQTDCVSQSHAAWFLCPPVSSLLSGSYYVPGHLLAMELCCSVCLCASSICDHHHLALAGELVPAGDPAAPASVGTVVVCVARVSPGGVWGPGHSDREECRYVSYWGLSVQNPGSSCILQMGLLTAPAAHCLHRLSRWLMIIVIF